MKRREILRLSIAGGLASAALRAQQTGATEVKPAVQPAANTPTDPEPQVNDIEKYPKCTYCRMDRKKFHYSRMLIHYDNDPPDPLCSLRCAGVSLTTHFVDTTRTVKAIWVSDNASPDEVKPLILVDKATFLVGSKLPGVMNRRSKVAYSDVEAARAAQAANGGELLDFDGALLAAYTDMAESVTRNRKLQEERLQRTQKPMDH